LSFWSKSRPAIRWCGRPKRRFFAAVSQSPQNTNLRQELNIDKIIFLLITFAQWRRKLAKYLVVPAKK
jgi:hypothetical protein